MPLLDWCATAAAQDAPSYVGLRALLTANEEMKPA
jgi:hypothetical protein